MRSFRLTLVTLTGLLLLPGCSDDTNKKRDYDLKLAPPTEAGGEKGPTSGDNIYDVNQGKVGDGATVNLKDMVVTAVGGAKAANVYAQDPKGGKYSGLNLYKPTRSDGAVTDLKPGDHITVAGKVQQFSLAAPKDFPNGKKLVEVVNATISKLKSDTAPAPTVISLADATTEDSSTIHTNPWQHVLVSVQNIPVGCYSTQYSELDLGGNVSAANELFSFTVPTFGDCKTFTGILGYFYNYYIWPRSDADITAGTGCTPVSTVTIKAGIHGATPPAANSSVKVSGVVTAVDTIATASTAGATPKYIGFWIEEAAGGTKSGIYVYYTWTDATPPDGKPKIGDNVDVWGQYSEYKSSTATTSNTLSEIGNACYKSNGAGTVPDVAIVADPATIATNGSAVKDYESVLVQVPNVKVGDPVTTTGTTPKTIGFKLDPSGLIIDNLIFDFLGSTPPAKGDIYKSITGVLYYSGDQYRLLPRSATDLQK